MCGKGEEGGGGTVRGSGPLPGKLEQHLRGRVTAQDLLAMVPDSDEQVSRVLRAIPAPTPRLLAIWAAKGQQQLGHPGGARRKTARVSFARAAGDLFEWRRVHAEGGQTEARCSALCECTCNR